MLLIAVILGWIGLCLGSFVNALVWRTHNGKDIVKGRSQCVHCGHILSSKDLIPVLSWLSLKGKCRYCQKPISAQYPLVEILTGLIFAFSYLLWPYQLSNGQLILLATWLICSVGLMAMLVYDLRWMLLPDKILLPTALIAIMGRLIYIIGYHPDKIHGFYYWILSIGIAAGIFWLLYQVSDRLIGGGDIKLGIITGTLLADPALSFLMIFLASVTGTLIMAPELLVGKKKMSSKLPFGPFLIIGTAISLFFGHEIINWYSDLAFR